MVGALHRWFTFALKTDPVWWNGSAVFYALSLDSFTTAVGRWLLQFPSLLACLSFATLTIEAIGPVLLFLPFYHGLLRNGVIVLFLCLHTDFALCLSVGLFPYVAGATWLALLPTDFWRRLRISSTPIAKHKEGLRQWIENHLGIRMRQSPLRIQRKSVLGSVLSSAFCLGCLVYVFLWNLRTVDFPTYSRFLPVAYNGFGYTLRLD